MKINIRQILNHVASGHLNHLFWNVSGFIAITTNPPSVVDVPGDTEVPDDHVVRLTGNHFVSPTKRGDLYLSPVGYMAIRPQLIELIAKNQPVYEHYRETRKCTPAPKAVTIEMIDERYRGFLSTVRVKPKPYAAYPDGLQIEEV